MPAGPLHIAHGLLTEAVDAVAAAGENASDDELLSVLMLCEGVTRRLDRVAVDTIAALTRRGVFAERGYSTPAVALNDVLGWERFEARRRVVAAEQVTPRIGLDGTALPAHLPATAAVFESGGVALRHVDVIARVLASSAAERLDVWPAPRPSSRRRRARTRRPSCSRGAPRSSRPSTRTAPSPTTGHPLR